MLLSMSRITLHVGKIGTAEWLNLKIHIPYNSLLCQALKTKVLPNISPISKCIKKVDKPSLEVLGW